jgi:hypothetical protein
VADQADVEGVGVGRGDNRLEPLVRPLGRDLRPDQPETARDPVDVRVDRDRRPPELEQQHAGGRLRPDARQGPQRGASRLELEPLERGEVEPPLSLDDRVEALLDPARLEVGQAADPDRGGQRRLVGRADRFPGRVDAP